MTFEKIDATFYQWAAAHNLQVYTDCKDEEVRMVRMYGDGKEFADIGVSEAPNGRYQVNVGIARRPSRISRFEQIEASEIDLNEALEQAYGKAKSWLSGSS